MARGATLSSLLTGLRAETRTSLNTAHNVQVRDTQVYHLQRVQEQLWEDYTWPHLLVFRYLETQAGQRYYDITGCFKQLDNGTLSAAGDMVVDRVQELWVKDGDIWRKLTPGITEDDYNSFDSTLDERDWPPRKWQVTENNQIELWLIPNINASTTTLDNIIGVRGVHNLAPLTLASHTADLDDRLLTLTAAAGLLGGEAGAEKQRLADRRLLKLRGNAVKTRQFRMFGGGEPRRILRGPPTVYYRTS